MGNPKPTKSKPCKIGRKHTGAPSIRLQAKKALGYTMGQLEPFFRIAELTS